MTPFTMMSGPRCVFAGTDTVTDTRLAKILTSRKNGATLAASKILTSTCRSAIRSAMLVAAESAIRSTTELTTTKTTKNGARSSTLLTDHVEHDIEGARTDNIYADDTCAGDDCPNASRRAVSACWEGDRWL